MVKPFHLLEVFSRFFMEKEHINLEKEFGKFFISKKPTGEQVIFVLPKPQPPTETPSTSMKPNRIRQAENLSRLTGMWHGTFYDNGRPQLPKKK